MKIGMEPILALKYSKIGEIYDIPSEHPCLLYKIQRIKVALLTGKMHRCSETISQILPISVYSRAKNYFIPIFHRPPPP